jgi:hypothetical protein
VNVVFANDSFAASAAQLPMSVAGVAALNCGSADEVVFDEPPQAASVADTHTAIADFFIDVS